MKTIVKIGNKKIGDKHPTYIIAEAGSNHNGHMYIAKRLIDKAADAGADAVKFQVFRAEKLYPKKAGVTKYLKMDKPIYEIIKDMEMPYEWIPTLAEYCKEKNIEFLASVFDEESADILDEYVNAHKIASYELTHIPLIRYVAKLKKPIILSTGASNISDIEESVRTIKDGENKNLCLMQCTAKYPAPLTAINVNVIRTFKDKFKIPVGLSDHSREVFIAPMAAVSVGAKIIEKHFTLDKNLPGPDHKFALEPDELKEMVEKINMVEKVLGSDTKKIEDEEKELFDFARRYIFASKDIKKGEIFTKDNLIVLRKGVIGAGIEPKKIDEVLGKKAARNILAEHCIQNGDFL